MAVIIPQISARTLIDQLGNFMQAINLRLFRNDVAPAQASTIGTFTEADFSGYAAAVLQAWTIPITVDGRAKIMNAVMQWAHDGGAVNNLVYGVYCEHSGELLWAERFVGAPINMQPGSPPITYIPVFTLISEFLS